jgi:hypothetical protein
VKERRGKVKIPLFLFITSLIMLALPLVYAEAQNALKEVKVLNNRLSVDLKDAEFGSVMQEIADMVGFEVKISAAISNKTLSTSFRDMDLQRGINRLLTLISQKNFFIYYGPDNSIRRIEVFLPASGPGRRSTTTWKPAARPYRGRSEPMLSPPAPMPLKGSPEMPGEAPAEEKPVEEELAGEASVGEEPEQKEKIPYIPPTQIPAYIPPAKDKQ